MNLYLKRKNKYCIHKALDDQPEYTQTDHELTKLWYKLDYNDPNVFLLHIEFQELSTAANKCGDTSIFCKSLIFHTDYFKSRKANSLE